MITLEVFGHKPMPWCVPTVNRYGGLKPTIARRFMQAWQDRVRIAANQAGQYIDGPVVIRADFYLPTPSSWPQWKRNAALSGEIAHTQAADVDNLAKNFIDGCKGALFPDDTYVSALSVSKTWVADVSAAGVSATVAPAIGQPSQVARRADLATEAADPSSHKATAG